MKSKYFLVANLTLSIRNQNNAYSFVTFHTDFYFLMKGMQLWFYKVHAHSLHTSYIMIQKKKLYIHPKVAVDYSEEPRKKEVLIFSTTRYFDIAEKYIFQN